MNLLTAFFGSLKEIFGFANKRTDLKNAPDVRNRAKANAETSAVAATTKAVATNNTEQLRNELAE